MAADGVWVLNDPERALIDFAETALAEREALPYVTDQITVSTEFPTGDTDSPDVPHVQLEWDGTPEVMQHQISARCTMRVTAWAATRTKAKQLALLMLALLSRHPGDDYVWAVTPLTGPLPTTDPDTGLDMATLTVRASVRAYSLAGAIE